MKTDKGCRNRRCGWSCIYPAVALILLFLPAAAVQASGETAFAETPLFLTESAQENVIFAFDDARSLDFEVIMPEADLGGLDQDSLRKWLGGIIPGYTRTGETLKEILLGDVKYGYVFEPGYQGAYNSRRINADYNVAPPLKLYAFLRSAEFNSQFYDPAVTYRPWPTATGTMPQANSGDPLLDPVFNLKFSDSMRNTSLLGSLVSGIGDLLSGFFGSCGSLFNRTPCPPELLEVRYQPFAISGSLSTALLTQFNTLQNVLVETVTGLQVGDLTQSTACELDRARSYFEGFGSLLDSETSTLNSRAVCIAHYPATYYIPVENATYRWRGAFRLSVNSGTCTGGPSEAGMADYEQFLDGFNENSLRFTDSSGREFSGALAPDGTCLREVNLSQSWPTGRSGFQDVNADVYARYGRTFAQELQNFANWYTYHRRRHQSLRGTIGETAVRMDNSRGALMKSSSGSNPANITMLDLTDTSSGGGLATFLNQVYTAYNGVTSSNHSTPRTLLNSAGQQFQRTDSNAPVVFECQKNFTVLYTDGYSNEGALSGIGNADSNAGVPFADNFPGTLADIAYRYYRDLGLSGNRVGDAFPAGRVGVPSECRTADPDPSVDCNTNLHMNTFVVTPGKRGESIWGHPVEEGSDLRYITRADAHANPPSWPDVNASNTLRRAAQRDDLYHAVVNGFGEMYAANDAVSAASGLRNAMTGAEVSQFESITAVAIARDQAVAGASLYSASFESGNWTGRLTARLLNPSNRVASEDGSGVRDSVLGEVEWEAGSLLNSRNLTNNPRQIITSNDSKRGVPFRWGSLSTEAIADLRRGQNESHGQARLNYLRGHKVEGFNFRERTSLLGDIVNSDPVYVGTPRQQWPDRAPFPVSEGRRYSDFVAQQRGRDPMVYVGSNNGMLHGFSAAVGEAATDGGQERLAYIPGFAFDRSNASGLSILTDPGYSHRYYVDLTPTIADAYFQGHGSEEQWHSVLLGGMRTGGRGLFALDITNPNNFSEANAGDLLLWEFTHSNLGYLTQPINVALVPWGDGEEWVAVFGNGYKPESGRAGLFMLKMSGGINGSWSSNDFRFIEVDSAMGDGLTSDARLVDLSGNGVIDRIYATDRKGRVWAFAADSDGQWRSAYTTGGGSSQPAPLFTATDDQGNPQPITTGVMVTRNPFTGSNEGDPNLLVLFGTGSYLSASDLTDFSTQSFYGIWDYGERELDRSKLQQQFLVNTEGTDGRFRNIDETAVDWDNSGITGDRGWFFDFDDETAAGERIMQMPRVEGDTLFFNTTIPEQNPCAAGGSGFRMFVSLSGGDPSRPVFDANNDGVVNALDRIFSGFRHTDGLLSSGQLFGGLLIDNTTGINVGRDEETRFTVVDFERNQRRGRLGWQELIRSR